MHADDEFVGGGFYDYLSNITFSAFVSILDERLIYQLEMNNLRLLVLLNDLLLVIFYHLMSLNYRPLSLGFLRRVELTYPWRF